MGTKKFRFVIVVLVATLLAGVIFAHRQSLVETRSQAASLEKLYDTEQEVSHLSFSLEHYRRVSASFRKMEPAEVAKAKSDLRNAFVDGMKVLKTDSEAMTKIQEQLNDFLAASIEVEKASFSKDAFQKETMRDRYAVIESEVQGLQATAQQNRLAFGRGVSQSDVRTMQIFYGASIGILGLLFSLLLENYLVFFRPLRKLHDYAAQVRNGEGKGPIKIPALPGVYGDIQISLSKLAENVENHLKERHKFIRDVVSDLKKPLSMLQAGRKMIANGGEVANSSLRQGLAILTGSLEDLNDITEINRLENKLNETFVDLTELISDVAKTFGDSQSVAITVPPMPVWVKIDRRRFERVLYQVVTKVTSTLSGASAGMGVHIRLDETKLKEGKGIEISVFDSSRLRKGLNSYLSPSATGPELDIVKHWISENGLGLALAYKVIRAHNGSIYASGVNGTPVQISIRLPIERMVGTSLILPPEVRNSAANEFDPKPSHS